jgi:hypothetical protein
VDPEPRLDLGELDRLDRESRLPPAVQHRERVPDRLQVGEEPGLAIERRDPSSLPFALQPLGLALERGLERLPLQAPREDGYEFFRAPSWV